jgi:uncharacterized protein (DUF924 family)
MSTAEPIHRLVDFWRDAGPDRWFAKDAAFDAELRARFLDAHFAAARREHEALLDDADGALALATDPLARYYADQALAAGHDQRVDPALRIFLYLPFEHSEALADQDRCVGLCEALGDAFYLKYAQAHRDVIRRFERFPHRNRALGRENTPEEQAWLDAGGGF